MATATIEFTDIFHTFTKEQQSEAHREWQAIDLDLEGFLLQDLDRYADITSTDPETLALHNPTTLRDCLIETGWDYIGRCYISPLLTDYLVHSPWDGLDPDNPYDLLVSDSETMEEWDEWNARGVLYSLTLWDTLDRVLTHYLKALKDYYGEGPVAEEFAKAWYLS